MEIKYLNNVIITGRPFFFFLIKKNNDVKVNILNDSCQTDGFIAVGIILKMPVTDAVRATDV